MFQYCLPSSYQKRYKKSAADAHLRDIAASETIACVIREVVFPVITHAADPCTSAAANTFVILSLLDAAAQGILRYKETDPYKEATRRAGERHGVSGITVDERAERAELRRAQAAGNKTKG